MTCSVEGNWFSVCLWDVVAWEWSRTSGVWTIVTVIKTFLCRTIQALIANLSWLWLKADRIHLLSTWISYIVYFSTLNLNRIIIVGDVSIQVDISLESTAEAALCILECFSFIQQISGPAHIAGHTLDRNCQFWWQVMSFLSFLLFISQLLSMIRLSSLITFFMNIVIMHVVAKWVKAEWLWKTTAFTDRNNIF